jgi:hypothetical protein
MRRQSADSTFVKPTHINSESLIVAVCDYKVSSCQRRFPLLEVEAFSCKSQETDEQDVRARLRRLGTCQIVAMTSSLHLACVVRYARSYGDMLVSATTA